MSTENQPSSIAIIGFTKEMSPLDPLWPSTHRALIPVCGKALIIHQIEKILSLGIKHIRIAGSIQQWAVRKRIKDGSEWGVKIRYSDLHANDLKTECLVSVGNCVFMMGDQLGSGFSSRNLHHSDEKNSETGLFNIKPSQLDSNLFNQHSAYKNPIKTIEEYHQANIHVVKNSKEFNLNGAKIHNDNAFMDWDSHIAPDAYIGKNVFVSKHCNVSRLARLEDNCVLSHGVVIGQGTKLRNVTVLTNCEIAPNLAIENSIITSSGMFDFNGKYWPFMNEGKLGVTRDNREALTGLPSVNVDF